MLKLSDGQDTIFKTVSFVFTFKIQDTNSILLLYRQDAFETILTKVKILFPRHLSPK